MKRKRLTREGWGFQHFPYWQMRVELPEFRGLVCLIHLTGGEECAWHMPRAGRVPVAGAGMRWLQLIPDGAHHVVTAKYRRNGRVSVWYADVTDRVEFDPDGVAAFVDLYLDVIFSPRGDVKIDDRDELDAAHASGEVSDAQYAMAIAEAEGIRRALCSDVRRTERWCNGILRHVQSRLEGADVLKKNS